MVDTSVYENLLKKLENAVSNSDADGQRSSLRKLKRLVVLRGIPDEKRISAVRKYRQRNERKSHRLRGHIWKALLGVGRVDSNRYLKYVKMGEHPEYGEKIRNDAFRTFQNDQRFAARVPETKLLRVLNAFVHAHSTENEEERLSFAYVQGMNALCGPLLYVLPELDAFYCFEVLVTQLVPGYVWKNMNGVLSGCHLVEECLKQFDITLWEHMTKKLKVSSKVYAFAPLLTLSACSPPLENVLQLWDFYFAAGVHLNVPVLAAQFILRRQSILKANKDELPSYLTGRQPLEVKPQSLLSLAYPLFLKLPKDFFNELIEHTQRV